MTILDVTKIRSSISESVSRAAFGKERVAIRRNGKVIAGLVSAEDLALLESLTNARDLKEAKRAIKDAKAKNEKPIPWSQAKKRLGL